MIKIVLLDRGRGRHFVQKMQAREHEQRIADAIIAFLKHKVGEEARVSIGR